ncbi:hypothetical protein NPIL_406721 [Nephila pilipes]|uniref:Uncharacterized protein n=1 Tax=Nephila pilipes TaxID=299642 RepID=A0A8X6MV75_NEPPI|nr:hypothetical protein NPIL_406721 [Nephila pilipes]
MTQSLPTFHERRQASSRMKAAASTTKNSEFSHIAFLGDPSTSSQMARFNESEVRFNTLPNLSKTAVFRRRRVDGALIDQSSGWEHSE